MPKIVGVRQSVHGFMAYCPTAGEKVMLNDGSHCPHCGVMNAHLDQNPSFVGMPLFDRPDYGRNLAAERRAMKGYAPGFKPPE